MLRLLLRVALVASLLLAACSFERAASSLFPSVVSLQLSGLKYDYVFSSSSKEQKKERLDVFLSAALPDYSRSFLG